MNFEQLEGYWGSLQIEVQLASRQLSTANLASLVLSQSGPGEQAMSTKQNTRAVQKVFQILYINSLRLCVRTYDTTILHFNSSAELA